VPYLEPHKHSDDVEVRRRVQDLLTNIKITGEVFCFAGHQNGIISIALLPGDRQALTASEDATIRLLDVTRGTELRRFAGHTKQVWALAVAADGKTFVSSGQDRIVYRWQLAEDKPRKLAELPDGVRCLQFSADGKRLLAGVFDEKIHVLDAESGAKLATWTGHHAAVLCLALSPDGRTLLSGASGRDPAICVRDASSGEVRRRLMDHREHVCAVAFVDDRHAVSAGYDNIVRLWNIETGNIERAFTGHDKGVYGLAVSRDRKRLLTGGYDKLVRLWDLETGVELRRFKQHEDGINALAFTANGRYALSASNDRTVRLLYMPRTSK
jgi:WD40 repeat protein